MNNEKKVRNFYDVEAEYEKSVLLVKELITKIINIDLNLFKEKLKYIEKENEYNEFIDLFNAVIGKKTNKYYYCENEEDVKYYSLKMGKVYKTSELNVDLQSRSKEEKILNLQARAILAEKMYSMIQNLRQDFISHVGKSDGSLATLDFHIIKEVDIEYLDNLIKYLECLMDKNNRLKILVAEKAVYAKELAENDYNKKSSVEKWVYKFFNKEQKVIDNMTRKNMTKK